MLGQGSQLGAVAVSDLPGARCVRRRDQFIAGGDHGNPGRPTDQRFGATDGGQYGQVLGAEKGTGIQHTIAPSNIVAPGHDIAAGLATGESDHAAAEILDLFDDEDAVRTFGHRRARHYLAAGARGDGKAGYAAGGYVLEYAQGREGVGGAAGIAVHRRLVEGGHVEVGIDGFRQDPVDGFRQGAALGGKQPGPQTDAFGGVFVADHGYLGTGRAFVEIRPRRGGGVFSRKQKEPLRHPAIFF